MIAAIKGIINRCLAGETNRAQAVEEAKAMIVEYIAAERGRAQAYLRGKTGIKRIALTPEMEAEYSQMAEEYIRDFERILDDALKNGGVLPD